jgi:hypothetical protein
MPTRFQRCLDRFEQPSAGCHKGGPCGLSCAIWFGHNINMSCRCSCIDIKKLTMSQTQFTDVATFLMRVALGIMFLAHSIILKMFVFTLPGTAQFFEAMGMPGWLAYVVFSTEVVAGVLLVLGVQTRWVALAPMPILAGATWAYPGSGCMLG